MPESTINEREFELINIVGDQLTTTQRDLSRHLDLSLGTTNILIKRLIAKGYIRITQLNRRKIKYILTPKGLNEKFQKSIHYTRKTINSIGLVKTRLKEILGYYLKQGQRVFYIYGEHDLVTLFEMASKEVPCEDFSLKILTDFPLGQDLSGVLFVCKEVSPQGSSNGLIIVNLINELAKDPKLLNSCKQNGEE